MIRLITICFFIVLAYGPCALKREDALTKPTSTNPFPELAAKQRLQQSIKRGAEKNVVDVKPFRTLNNREAGIVFPASLCYSNSGGLYISDNNGQKIQYWPSDSAVAKPLRTEAAQGELKFPNDIHWSRDQILVADNEGIKTFSPEGHLERLTRSFFGVSSFTVTDKGTILDRKSVV